MVGEVWAKNKGRLGLKIDTRAKCEREKKKLTRDCAELQNSLQNEGWYEMLWHNTWIKWKGNVKCSAHKIRGKLFSKSK